MLYRRLYYAQHYVIRLKFVPIYTYEKKDIIKSFRRNQILLKMLTCNYDNYHLQLFKPLKRLRLTINNIRHR